jgi:hypothetical protein
MSESSVMKDTSSSAVPDTIPGRAVRLHFECVAEIPIGCFLRVTGSALWAPGVTALDPAEAGNVYGRTEQSAFQTTEPMTATQQLSALYTSSVEMVTTPETYPVWKTRKPVVVTLNRHAVLKKTVQHHYYRYLVVAPGMTVSEYDTQSGNDPTYSTSTVVSTSSEFCGSTVVMQWEDPFGSFTVITYIQWRIASLQHQVMVKIDSHIVVSTLFAFFSQERTSKNISTSTVSLASMSVNFANNTHTQSDYRNLPYRTLDINVTNGSYEPPRDRWNSPDDVSFQPYRIREAVRELDDTHLVFFSC